tara:strand:+ start:291638 stop:291997 length:360 start_codon:yes stop_codon:yes gene_type:complete
MKIVLKLEELLMLILGIYFFSLLSYEWWWFLILLLTPDIGMLGYLFNPKIGSISYTIFHHKGVAIVIYLWGIYLSIPLCQLVGIILFSYAAMDRFFGYGLKYEKGFKYTHLGEIGNTNG